jgi:phosphopantetheinyl transferase
LFEQRLIGRHISLGILDLGAFAMQMAIEGKRPLEKAGTQYVLQQLLKNNQYTLEYTSNRKPFLKGVEGHISISHSHERLAVIYDLEKQTGVDIELIRDKVLNIQHKFLSEQELETSANKVDELITLWAAKEALYKVHGEKELDFSKHILVQLHNGVDLTGEIRTETTCRRYKLKAERLGDYKLVYILDEL